LWTATVGWNTNIFQMHSFRQTQTAAAAYYIAEGGPVLKYENPVLGPPWSIPFEFPLYQWVVAKVYNATGWGLESTGRVVAKVFYYLCLLPLLLLAWQYGVRGAVLTVPLTLFLLSPLYLYWSRQFMIESTATFFGLAYLACAYRWEEKGGWGWFAAALLTGICAALVKSTSYACFALAVGLLFTWVTWKGMRWDKGWLFRAAVLLLVPLIAGLAWAKFTDIVKEQNPLADFITSAALKEWNFGTLAQRLDGNFWYKIFRQTIRDSIGHRTGWILSVALALAWGRRAALYWIFSALFIVAPLIFTNLYIIHNYYACANGVFLVLAVAVMACQMLHGDAKWARAGGLAIFLLVAGFEVREFMRQPYYEQQVVNNSAAELGQKLQELVPPEKVLLIFGWDWDSTVPFFARRRAIMARGVDWRSPKLARSMANLKAEGREVGAVLYCGHSDQNATLYPNPHVGPKLASMECNVYAWRN
jgi:hypothetical protein